MLFDEEGFMMKPVKSELIRVLEKKLESGDYSYHHQRGSAFMLLFAGYPLLVCSAYQIHRDDIYHTYGCCDYIFDIYDDTHQ